MKAVPSAIFRRLRAKWTVITGRRGGMLIKGEMYSEPNTGLFPGFSASGQDVWVEEAQYSEPGIVVSAVGARCGKAFKADGQWTAIANTHVLLPREGFDRDFLWWGFNDEAFWLKGGSAQPYVQFEDSLEQVISVPSSEKQQRAIADFLDRETARLDGLATAKERLLEILAEKRRELIARAVTRGLNPNTPLRNSGIPWLGQIPAHWKTVRLAWLFRERDERCEPELPLLEVSINSGVAIRQFSDDRIESTAADFNTYKVARKGDIVFNKMRMWQGAVGLAPEDGLVSPDYTVAAPIGVLSPEYAGVLFRTDVFSAECARQSHGIVWDRLRLYWDGFRDIIVPVPPPDEQRATVAHIASETAKLDSLRASAERTISLLKERRAALIAAAVTGQLKISEAA